MMSLKVCTDELLMDLAPPSASPRISYLSREKAALKLWPEAARLPVNHNSAEEVLTAEARSGADPGLCLAGHARAAGKSGIRFLEVPQAENFDQIRAVTRHGGRRRLANAPRAEQLIARMDATLARTGDRQARADASAWWAGAAAVLCRAATRLFNAVLR